MAKNCSTFTGQFFIFHNLLHLYFLFQLFSRISFALAKQTAVTLPDLLRVIQSAYSPMPITCKVENIYNDKAWLRQYTRTSTFQHHSHPHAFRFKLNNDGDMEMPFRQERNGFQNVTFFWLGLPIGNLESIGKESLRLIDWDRIRSEER